MEWQFDMAEVFDLAIEKANKDKVEVQITIEPERIEFSVQPWKPYEMRCPYDVRNTEEANEESHV